jgi:hypothetical protein
MICVTGILVGAYYVLKKWVWLGLWLRGAGEQVCFCLVVTGFKFLLLAL